MSWTSAGLADVEPRGNGEREDSGSFPRAYVSWLLQNTGAKPIGLLAGHVGKVYYAAFHPDGTRIVTGGNDGTVRILDARTLEQLFVLRGRTQCVQDAEYSPDGAVLASASGDTTIRLWETLPLAERRAKGRP